MFLTLAVVCLAMLTDKTSSSYNVDDIGEIADVLDGTFQYEVGNGPILKLSPYTTELILRKPVILALNAKEKSESIVKLKEHVPEPTSRFLKIIFEDVWQEYQIIYRYNFTAPKISANCHCVCDEYPTQCYNTSIENMEQPQSKDAQYFQKSFNHYHCDSNAKFGSMCCNLTLSPDKDNVYYAFHFEVPKTYYNISWSVFDHSGVTLQNTSLRLESPITENRINEIGSTIKVESFPSVINLHSKWAFSHRNDLKKIKTKLSMNDPQQNGFSKAKLYELGWYQLDNHDKTINLPPDSVLSAFVIAVSSCDNNGYTWQFNAFGCENGSCNNIITSTDVLQEIYDSDIEKVELFQDKRVIIHLRNNPTLKVTVNFGFDYRDILSEEHYDFESFIATLDENTQYPTSVLNIAIVNGYGQIVVSIKSNKFKENQVLLVPSLVRKTFVTKVILPVMVKNDTSVCLSTSNKHQCCIVSLHKSSTPETFTPGKTTDILLAKRVSSDVHESLNSANITSVIRSLIISVTVVAIMVIILYLVTRHCTNSRIPTTFSTNNSDLMVLKPLKSLKHITSKKYRQVPI